MSVFDDASRKALAQHLRSQPEDISAEAEMIEAAIVELRRIKGVPGRNVKEGCRQLRARADRLAYAAKDLRANTAIGDFEIYKQPGGATISEMEFSAALLEFTSKLLNSAAKSETFRSLNRLPPGGGKRNRLKPETWVLWPVLVRIWISKCGRPTSTPGGPFFRLVKFVHGLAGLKELHPETLKSALRRWTKVDEEMRAQLQCLAELYHIRNG